MRLPAYYCPYCEQFKNRLNVNIKKEYTYKRVYCSQCKRPVVITEGVLRKLIKEDCQNWKEEIYDKYYN